MEKIE